MTRRLVAFALGLALFLILSTIGVVLAQGGQLGGKVYTGGDITIPASETIDHDIYAFGGTVVVNGKVNGDVVAAGGNVDLNGPVTGDVLAAGGRVNVTGAVSGDVRAAGGQVTVGGDVTEDVLVTGGQVTMSGRVGQDLIASGSQFTLSGAVTGGAVGSVGTYTKSGSVAGTDSITVTGDQSAAFARAPANPVLDAIRHFLVVLLVAALALWLAPQAMRATEAWVRERSLPALGWGLAAFVGYFVLIIVLVVVMIVLAILFAVLGFGSLLGIDIFGGLVLIAAITLAFIVVAAFVADAIVGLALARLVVARSGRAAPASESWLQGPDRWANLGWLAVGIGIIVVLTSLPIVGGFVKLVVVLLAFGAIWLAWRQRRAGPGLTPAAPPEPMPPAPPQAAAG
jgi:hypothetical protein